jgi:predicted nucleotidyltransferase
MPARSSTSAGATYLERDARIRELRALARRLAQRLPEIRRVILYGSTVTGIPTPRSDADLLVHVASSRYQNPADRVPEVMKAMRPVGFPLDVRVYTTEELDDPAIANSSIVRTALRDGIDLLQPVK